MVFIDFSTSEAPKNHEKSMPKRTRKKHRKKTSQKSIFASILASQNLPKSTQHRKKSQKIAFKKKLKKKSLATKRKSTETNGNQRKPKKAGIRKSSGCTLHTCSRNTTNYDIQRLHGAPPGPTANQRKSTEINGNQRKPTEIKKRCRSCAEYIENRHHRSRK